MLNDTASYSLGEGVNELFLVVGGAYCGNFGITRHYLVCEKNKRKYTECGIKFNLKKYINSK